MLKLTSQPAGQAGREGSMKKNNRNAWHSLPFSQPGRAA